MVRRFPHLCPLLILALVACDDDEPSDTGEDGIASNADTDADEETPTDVDAEETETEESDTDSAETLAESGEQGEASDVAAPEASDGEDEAAGTDAAGTDTAGTDADEPQATGTDSDAEESESGEAEPPSEEPPSEQPPGDVGDGGSELVPEPVEGSVPMFVAVGHAGRTTLSCDDGRSWVADRSDEPELRCFDENAGDVDCDHRDNSGTGIAYGNGWFVTTFGWGAPGSIRRSRDAVDWEIVAQGDDENGLTSSGLAYGHDFFLTGARYPMRGDGDAASWESSTELPLSVWNVRQTAFVGANGGTFVVFAQDGDTGELVVSTDGEEWEFSESGSEQCSGNGFAYGNGVILMVGNGGCRSVDGGSTWEALDLPHAARTPPVWMGDVFAYWGLDDGYNDAMFTSVDGVQWQMSSASANDGERMRLGPVALSPEGTLVGVRGEWQQWYESQRFYRSTDGIEWETVEEGQYVGSHPIREIVFGYGQTSAQCP